MSDESAPGWRRRVQRSWLAVAVAVLVVGALVVLGANRPADPYLLDAGEFSSVSFTIAEPGTGAAATTERCALLAETAEQQALGLMNRTELEGRDGMLFRFAADVRTGFFMKDTPLPLSIAWFDAAGSFVSATDMAPCLGQQSCPTYMAAGPFRYALEVPRGRLRELGAVPGSRLAVGRTCG